MTEPTVFQVRELVAIREWAFSMYKDVYITKTNAYLELYDNDDWSKELGLAYQQRDSQQHGFLKNPSELMIYKFLWLLRISYADNDVATTIPLTQFHNV